MQTNDLLQNKPPMYDSQKFDDLLTNPFSLIKTQKPSDEQVQNRLAKIRAKLKAGKKLSAAEMSFLQQYDQMLYRTAQRVEMQRQQTEAQLKSCKSKEQASNVISSTLGAISSKDPDAEYLTAAVMDVMKKFQKQGNYQAMPGTTREANEKDEKNGKKKKRQHRDNDAEPEITGIYNRNGIYTF